MQENRLCVGQWVGVGVLCMFPARVTREGDRAQLQEHRCGEHHAFRDKSSQEGCGDEGSRGSVLPCSRARSLHGAFPLCVHREGAPSL